MCNIFISHKDEDEKAARQIKELLETFGKDKLHIFISEEIRSGENWREIIIDQLSKSNLLLLLFTEPRLSWDWCLYETGLFMDLKGNDRRKVICIHTPISGPPDPISHLESIPAQVSDIKNKFLIELFAKTTWTGEPEPINPEFANNEALLQTTAESICSFFEPKETDSKFINRYFILLINEPDKLDDGAIPDDAIIRSRFLANVFGVAGDESHWQLIAENQKDSRWIQQLEKAIKKICEGLIPEQIQATFLSQQNDVIRPILYRVDRLSNGAMEFYLLLVSDVSGKGGDVPMELMTMATVLRMATRFRYEVIEGYQQEIRRAQNEEELNNILDKIREAITRIESEAQSRMAVINENALRELYKSEEDKEKIVHMFDNWFNTRQELFNNDAILGKDRLLELFDNLRQMNGQFMYFTSNRYSELVGEKMC